MRTCETCGEPIAPGSALCPYCETVQSPSASRPASSVPVRTVDIEAGLPTVEEALRRLQAQLDRARAEGVALVRVVHGWGSNTGGGGRIRAAARRWLDRQLEQRRIRLLLFGDEYTSTSPAGRDLVRRHPALRSSERTDRRNPGITFVEP